MSDLLYFKRKRKDKDVLQELQWKSFTDSNAKGRDILLDKVLSGEYVIVEVALPRYMVEGRGDVPTS